MPLDVGLGLILGAWLHSLTTLPYGLCLVTGITSTLLPDLDFIWVLLHTKKAPTSSHRDGLHYPLLFVPAVGIIGWLIHPHLGTILMIGALLHFLHDSIGVGFGIKWLFPFLKNSYMFFYKAGLPTNTHMPRKILYSWTNVERTKTQSEYGDPQWIRHIYFQLHPFGIIEYGVLLSGIAVAVLYK